MFETMFAILLAAAPPLPRLCVGLPGSDLMSESCIDAPKNEIDVATVPKIRRWIWIDAARQTIALGTINADASKIVVDAKPSLLFSLNGSSEREWPAPATFVVNGAGESWRFTLPREIARSLRAMAIADGAYEMRVEVPHYFPFERRRLEVRRAKPVQLGRIDLKPLPRLTGRFVDRRGGPIADVAVSTPDGDLLATSSPAGLVSEEMRGPLPVRLFVRAAGYGHRAVEVTRSESDFDFGTVTLTPGATLTINLVRNGYAGPITASLIRPAEHTVGQRTTFETHTIGRESSVIELRDIEAREYVLLLRGTEPLQVLREDITIGEHENATRDIRLESRMVKGFVHSGNKVMAKTSVDLTGGNGEWRSSTATDDDGRFQSEAWQDDDVGVRVGHPPQQFYSTTRHIGADDTQWDIDIPARRIRGVVVDKVTGAPVPLKTITVAWKREGGGGGGMRGVPVGTDGRFDLDMLDPGHFEFTAHHPSYLDAVVSIDLRREDHEREVRLEMQRGRELKVRVQSADGSPVENAAVIASRTPNRMPRQWMTDSSGIATLILSDEESLPVWVATPNDSFVFATIPAEKRTEPAQITLPPANATIDVRVQRTDGAAVTHAHLFFSYNGQFTPYDVRYYLSATRVRMHTGSDGRIVLLHMPAGEYDFFVWETLAEHLMLSSPAPLGPPTHASVLPGENTVVIRVKGTEPKKEK